MLEAPGPGQWMLDTGHFPRPATRFTAELFPEPSRHGFADGTAPFGLLLDHLEWAFVNGWGYLAPRTVAALHDVGTLTRRAWDDLVDSSPELRTRLATSARVFEDRVWRADLALWDDELKPALMASHLRLQRVDPVALPDSALIAHLHACRANLLVAVRTHHRFNVTPVLPVGELLVRCRQWTDASAAEVLGLLRGAGPLAVGASDQLARAADAIRADDFSRSEVTSSHDSTKVLRSLLSRPGPVGAAMSGYVDLVGNWSAGHGFDIDEPTLMEMPELLVESLRVAVGTGTGTAADACDTAEEDGDGVRRAVPAVDRPAFDEVLGEARLVHRLRDERALYCDVWANGLMRRAVLAGGLSLVARGRINHPVHLVEATYAEMQSLLGDDGAGAPSVEADDLAARAARRGEADPATVPPVLGRSSRSPVPTAWLSPGAARTEGAFRTYLAAMSGAGDEQPGPGSTVRGVPASPGVYQGRARLVHGAADLGEVRDGDIVVTESTSPAFNIVLPLLGAIVTDRGGMLSHAAIVAREYGIPAVVGAGDATTRVPDGAIVRVDGTTGEATVV